MQIQEIFKRIKNMSAPVENAEYSLFLVKSLDKQLYYGINIDGNIVFAIKSLSPQIQPTYQKTKKLIFWFNAKCNMNVERSNEENIMHVLTCLSNNDDEIMAFVRLTLAFSDGISAQKPKKLNELFTSLTNLFASDRKINKSEIQGFYAELYTIYYLDKFEVNLSSYWQKKEKLKFDFSISEKKRIEIKSTTKEIRVHHFKHEQLLSDLYDIRVISFLLRQDDAGYTLFALISEVRSIAATSFETLMYIEDFIKNLEPSELRNTKYDSTYIENHIRIYNAVDIPKFSEGQPNGVTQTEYDSDLSTAKIESINSLINWIKE